MRVRNEVEEHEINELEKVKDVDMIIHERREEKRKAGIRCDQKGQKELGDRRRRRMRREGYKSKTRGNIFLSKIKRKKLWTKWTERNEWGETEEQPDEGQKK